MPKLPGGKHCKACGSANPYLVAGKCENRRACEGRQMLARGEPVETAAAHAQQADRGRRSTDA